MKELLERDGVVLYLSLGPVVVRIGNGEGACAVHSILEAVFAEARILEDHRDFGVAGFQ